MVVSHKKNSILKFLFQQESILFLLFAALVLRLFFSPYLTLMVDQNTFIGWSERLVEVGFSKFYDSWSDYLPGYLYILWSLGKMKAILPIPPVILYKLPAIVADLLTGLIIFKIVKKLRSKKIALLASALYLFNPAIFANSSFWGQVDSLTALFSLLAIWLVDKNLLASSLSLGFGTLVKPQAALAAPVVLFIMLKKKWKRTRIFSYILLSFSLFLAGFIPFAWGKSLFPFVWQRILLSVNQYPYSSVNAFNFWGLFGFWRDDSFTFQLAGFLFVSLLGLLAGLRLWKQKGSRYLLASLLFSSSFFFFTRMHERHLLPALAPLVVGLSFSPALTVSYVGLSFFYLANLFYSYNWVTYNFIKVFSPLVIKIFILFGLAFFGLMVFEVFKKDKKLGVYYLLNKFFKRDKLAQGKKQGQGKMISKDKLSAKSTKKLLALILVFSFLTRTLWLNSPKTEYFDEVYHAFTARRMLHNDPKAWEWWNTPPEGYAYEWTHPPLAKMGMVLGMLVFGENAFGWRVVGALLGVGSVYLVFLIAKKFFEDRLIALFSAAIFSLDGLPLVMSRIGMNDTYLLFFSLLTIYLFVINKNFLSALALGLAFSSKWSAFWVVPILIISHFVFGKKVSAKYFWFLVLPPLIYVASYAGMFLTGHEFTTFIEVQKQMWWYHTNLNATHTYASPWWSWPVMARPIWLYTKTFTNDKVANIYAMGNPAVFWGGFISFFLSLFYLVRQKLFRSTKTDIFRKRLGLVIFSYLIFFVPWAMSPRIMFLYHYLPSISFMVILIAFVLRKFPRSLLVFFTLSFILFIYLFPHLTGLPIAKALDNSYYWFFSWR